MTDLAHDIFQICSTPLRLYSEVLPETKKKRKVVPKEEFYETPTYEKGDPTYER